MKNRYAIEFVNCTLPKMTTKEREILTLEQARRFLQLLDENAPLKYDCFFNIAVYGGFRRGGILGLQWSDIDFDNGLVHINRAVHWDKKRGYYYTEPKTAKSKRTVHLSERVMMLLKKQKNEQLSAAFNCGDYWKNDGDLVFTSDDGAQMSMGTPYAYLTKFCKAYGLPKISVHSLRHINHMKTSSLTISIKQPISPAITADVDITYICRLNI